MAEAAEPSRVGSVIAGKYRLDSALGAGGVGQVFRAWSLFMRREVAVKLLRRELVENKEFVARFLREARAMSLVRSPHVVDIYDAGMEPDGTPYIVTEVLKGEDLQAHIARMGGKLPEEVAVEVLLPILDAIGIAHAKGVVHRDLKPENIFMAEVGGAVVPKVLDFGISKIAEDGGGAGKKSGDSANEWDESPGEVTRVGTALGTPEYMAPEQIQDFSHMDVRSDVWALGVVLYEVISGTLPFSANSAVNMMRAVCLSTPRPILEADPSVSPALAEIIMRCLRRDPKERYATAAGIALDIRKARGTRQSNKPEKSSGHEEGDDLLASLNKLEIDLPALEAAAEKRIAAGSAKADPYLDLEVHGVWRLSERLPSPSGRKRYFYTAERMAGGEACEAEVLPNIDGLGAPDPTFERRFVLEASLAARISHPNVVKLHDYGRLENLEPESFFLVSDRVDARTLATRLSEHPDGLSVAESLHFAREIAAGLYAAHQVGAVHRALEPGVIRLHQGSDGKLHARIGGFANVTVLEGAGLHHSQPKRLAASPSYTSPEQVTGDDLDGRTDLYTLGVMLFHSLTGKPPFEGATPMKILVQHANAKAPRLVEKKPGLELPEGLEELVASLLEKQPGSRPHDAAELLKRMDNLARSVGTIPPEPRKAESVRPPTPAPSSGRVTELLPPTGGLAQGRPRPLFLFVGLAVLLGFVGLWLASR